MAINWTEFPPHVELFGDLFSIYETLDQRRYPNFTDHSNYSENAAYTGAIPLLRLFLGFPSCFPVSVLGSGR